VSNLGDLTGTPWHIEQLRRAEGDDRRHRSRCIYYRKDGAYCTKNGVRCIGSAHCDYYKENQKVETQTVKIKQEDLLTPVPSNENFIPAEILFPIGSKVNHTRYGLGEVIASEGLWTTVRFANDTDNPKKFDANQCENKRLLERVNVGVNTSFIPLPVEEVEEKQQRTEPPKVIDNHQQNKVVSHIIPSTPIPEAVDADTYTQITPKCIICKDNAVRQASILKDGRIIRMALCADCLKKFGGKGYINVGAFEDLRHNSSKLQHNDIETEKNAAERTEGKTKELSRREYHVIIAVLGVLLMIAVIYIFASLFV